MSSKGYKERKAQIGRTAVENCSFEQGAIDECYERGNFTDKMLMCRTETRAFDRCYVMQSRFLKALGYMSTYDRPTSMDEEIQMHADTLYHRMLEQEAAVNKAKEAGEPIPTFPPILAPSGRKPQSFRTATIDIAASTPTQQVPSQQIPSRQPAVQQTPAEENLAVVAAAEEGKGERAAVVESGD